MDGGCPVISRSARTFLDGIATPENPPAGEEPEAAFAALQRNQALLTASAKYESIAVNALKESCQRGRRALPQADAEREMDHLLTDFRDGLSIR